MISGGDEFARSQDGNNNVYCQDNELSWFSWDRSPEQQQLTEFVSRLIQFRKTHPVFRRPKFFQGRPIRGLGIKDIMWFNPDGQEMSDEEWSVGYARSMGVLLSGLGMDVRDFKGEPITDDTFVFLFNAHHEQIDFKLPRLKNSRAGWEIILDTNLPEGFLVTKTVTPRRPPSRSRQDPSLCSSMGSLAKKQPCMCNERRATASHSVGNLPSSVPCGFHCS